jgi:Flp pilus assembly protein TadD
MPQTSPTTQPTVLPSATPKSTESELDSSLIKLIIPELWKLGTLLVVSVIILLSRKRLAFFFDRVFNSASTVKLGVTGAEFQLPNSDTAQSPNLDEKNAQLSNKNIPPPSEQRENKEDITETEILNIEDKKPQDLIVDLFDIARKGGDLDELEEAYNTLQSKEQDEIKKLENEGTYLFLRFQRGDTSSLEKLKKLAKHEEAANKAYYLIALVYASNNNIEKAVENYELSIKHCKKESDKAYRVVLMAESLHEANSHEAAYERILKEINQTDDTEGLVKLYTGLAELYKKDKELWLRALALEKAVELKPNDTGLLFDLAYAYGETKQYHLSVFHYFRLLHFQPKNAGALNNLGVNFDNLGMPIYSISQYKKSSELKNTLASANLAYHLINIGFAEEASKILNEAKEQENFHSNVASAIAELAKKEEEELKKNEEIRKLAIEHQQFFRNYAERYFNTAKFEFDLSGLWAYGDDRQATISQNGNEIETFLDIAYQTYKFTGTINNLTISIGRYKKEKKFLSDEFTYNFDKGGRAYISNEGNQVDILISGDDSPNDASPLIRLNRKESEKLSKE